MDFMCEQVVRCNLGTKKIIYKLLILLLALAIPAIIVASGMITQVYYCFIVAAFVALFCIYGVWFFWSELNIEFEYAVFSGELSISKVVANRKRKEVLKLDLRMVENIEIYQNQKYEGNGYEKIYECAESEQNAYMIAFKTSKQKGLCMLIFSPNEKMLKTINRGLRADVRLNLQ